MLVNWAGSCPQPGGSTGAAALATFGGVRQLLPPTAGPDIDPATVYAADDRTPRTGGPWVMVNMISSADGATSLGGVSGPLGGPADKRVFAAIRALADVILVGAGTVRAERYGAPRVTTAQRERRQARGQEPLPRLAVVSAKLQLEPSDPIFAAEPRPLVFTVQDADADRRAALAEVADVVVSGLGWVNLVSAVDELHQRGAGVILSEGGPSLNGALVAAGLVDELCLTLAPRLIGGVSSRIAQGGMARLAKLRLDRVLEDDGLLFLRYVRR